MRKKISLLTFLMMFCSFLFGQTPDWGDFNYRDYDFNMTVTAVVEIDDDEQANSNLIVAPFYGNERRGNIISGQVISGRTYYYLGIFGNYGDVVTFKLYDSENQTEYISSSSVNFVPNGIVGSSSNPYIVKFNSVAEVDEMKFGRVMDAVNYAQAGDVVTVISDNEITSTVVVNKNITLDLNGKKITAAEDVYPVIRIQEEAEVTVTGNGAITNATDYVFVLGASDSSSAGNLVINGGSYKGETTVASVTKGLLTINGGEFSLSSAYENNYNFLINCIDANYKNGTAKVAIKGGKFYSFNPENNAAEGAGTDFCAEGYTAVYDAEGYWEVIEAVAKIGDVNYTSLVDAINAAQEYDVITILRDAKSEEPVVVNKDITIDFAGFTYDGALNLNATATLNVVGTAGNVTSIVLNEGAQIYHSYALETTIVRNIAGTDSGWGTLSAPIATGNVVFNTTGTGRHDFYKYEESAKSEWVFVDVEENAYTMQPGRGYLYANKENVVASFTGALNMDDVKYVLSCTNKETDKELSGLNMIGNPFTHNINVNHLDGEIAEAFYSVATSGEWEPNVEESIAPLQAVLVQTDAKGTLTIKKTATRERGVSEGRLKINVANMNYADVAYVLFKEGLGLSKISHFNTEIPMVSVNVEGKEYAVATMNKEVTEIPVSFKAMTMGEYTISVEAQDVEETIYLTDKLTGERVNLNTDSYTFMATSNDNTDRFVLTKVLDTTGIEQNAEYSVYVSKDEIRFNNLNGNLNVRIYDMLGRPVAEYNVFESATISTSSFETGMYILQMTDENGVRTQKVLVN